jgi:hypothetical protein
MNEEQKQLVRERIMAYQNQEPRFNIHPGVGGLTTMDLANFQGGPGRGDYRLQFHQNTALAVVNHSDQKW